MHRVARLLRQAGFAVPALLLALGLGTGSAWAQGFEWTASTYENPDKNNEKSAQLSYLVPETDNIRFHAFCSPTSNLNAAIVLMDYDTGLLDDGMKVSVRASTRRSSVTLEGVAFGTKLEVGVSGVQLNVPLDHPFWDVLSAGSRLTYQIKGRPQARLGLRGSARAVGQFIDDCRTLQVGNSPDDRPGPTATAAPTCEQFGQAKSLTSQTPVTVTFVNRTDSYRSLMWIDFEGRPVERGNLNPGESFTARTYVTHPWMMTDGPGNCIEMFMPEDGVTRFEISRKSPGFGPE